MTLGSTPTPTCNSAGSRRSTGRDNNFDALRLIAALCVVVEHAVVHFHGRFMLYTPENGLWFFDGVAVFFILSGAMVYASAEKCRREGRPTRDYLLNRLLRVAPAIYTYLIVTVIALVALGVVSFHTLGNWAFMAWVASGALLVPVYHPGILAGFGTGVVNGSLWTIPVEVGFYILVPALVWAAAKVGLWRMLLGASIAAVSGVLALSALGGMETEHLAGKVLGVTVLPWLGYFIIGIAATRLWPRLPQHRAVAVLALAIYLGMVAARRTAPEALSPTLALLAAVPLAYLAFWIGHRGPAVLRRATSRIGDLSFGVYIWHMPLINLGLWAGFTNYFSPRTAVTTTIVASIAMAFVSWHLVEKPALGLKRYSSAPATVPVSPR